MKIEILTTWTERKTRYGRNKRPNLDIKSINGKPFKATYKYLPNKLCKAIIEFKEV